MQTTLLGLAVAIILALVTALVGPLFVDWGRWRAGFEAEATRLVGMPVRVSGRIDARLLPTPSLLLNGIEVGEPGHEPKLAVRSLGVEFALPALMRGEWRAAQLHLDGPQVTLGIDAAGRIEVPKVSIAFDPDQLSFDSVAIENGRAVLVHAASGTRVVLDQLTFRGDVRSLLGPFKGEGAFVSSGQRYGYSVGGSRRGDDGGMRLRLALDPSDRPLSMASEGTFRVDGGEPRYEGNLTLARPAGLALSDGTTLASDPWRMTSRVKLTPAAALLEQIDFQYGPEDRAIKLGGTAELDFGANAGGNPGEKPRFEGVLSARQIDLDRALQMPDATRRAPVALMRSMADTLAAFGRPPVPVKIGLGVDSVTLGGAPLLALRGDVRADADGWSLDSFEVRAPGATQVRASGRLTIAPGVAEFVGPASIDSADPKALVAWLEGNAQAPSATIGALRARGDVTLGAARLAVDGLKAELDDKQIEGRLAYAFAADQRPARLDAALNAAEIDLDGALAFAGKVLAGTTFDRPGEVALALDFGRASYAGIVARGATATIRFDASGLAIDRLSIADFGGAVLNASGHVDTTSPSPRGSIAIALDAQQLTGVAALAARFAPDAADVLQTMTQRAASAKLAAKLDLAPTSTGSDAKTAVKLTVDGAVAGARLDLRAEGTGNLAAPAAADLGLVGHLDADDGAGLALLLGLDRLATVDRRPASVVVRANGSASGGLRVDGRFAGAGLDAAARGTLRLVDARPRGVLDVTFAAANARLPGRHPTTAVPVKLATRLSIDGDRLTLDALGGKIADTDIKGRMSLALGHPLRVDGQIDAGGLDAAAVIAAAIGTPASARHAGPWSSEPFAPGPLADVDGRIAFTVARAALGAGIEGRDLRGTVRLAPSTVKLEDVEGSVGEGRLAAQAEFHAATSGLSAVARLSVTNADLAMLMPRSVPGRASGRISLRLDAQGGGLSPAALIGALQGSGSITADNVQLAGLDPNGIDAAVRAADRGVPIDAIRIGDIVRTALESGRLNVPAAGGPIAIGGGRLTLGPLAAPAQGADVSFTGDYDLGADAINLRFDLIGPPRANPAGSERPQLSVTLDGPLDGPRRNVDVTSLVNWLSTRAVEQEAKRLEAAEQEAKRIRAQQDEARRRAEAARRAAEQAAMPTTTVAPSFDKVPDLKAPELPPAIEIKPAPGGAALKPRHRSLPAPPGSAAPMVITPQDAR